MCTLDKNPEILWNPQLVSLFRPEDTEDMHNYQWEVHHKQMVTTVSLSNCSWQSLPLLGD